MGRVRPKTSFRRGCTLPRTFGGLSILLGFFLPTAVFAHGVEISGGIHTNFDSDHRQNYGNASAFSVAYSAPLSPRDVHLIFEVGYSGNSGSEWPTIVYASFDPTKIDYWFVPVTLGIRTNLVPERYQGPLGLYFGIGFLTVFTGVRDASGSYTAPTLGGMVELRPQLRVADAVFVWARERLSVLANAQYDTRTISYSGAALQLGLSLGAP